MLTWPQTKKIRGEGQKNERTSQESSGEAVAVCVLGMVKRRVDNPGDHLLDCLWQPRRALERAARKDIPLKETAFVAVIGQLGLGWALSGLVLGQFAAFERFVLGAALGLAIIAPLALYLGAMNALQPPGDGPPATLKTSFAIFVTGLVGPSVVTLSMGVGGLALTSWVQAPWAAAAPALIALSTWTVGLVVQVVVMAEDQQELMVVMEVTVFLAL